MWTTLVVMMCATCACAVKITPEMINAAQKTAVETLEQHKRQMIKVPRLRATTEGVSGCPFASVGVHYLSRGPNRKTADVANVARVFEETTRALVEKTPALRTMYVDGYVEIPQSSMQALQSAPLENTELSSLQSQCNADTNIYCDPFKRYRESDGSCNNLRNPAWGKSFRCMNRFLEPDYFDGISEPRGGRLLETLPNARLISRTIHVDGDRPLQGITHMLMQVGQFLDHDLALAPLEANPKEIINLGNPNNVIDCCSDQMRDADECFSIEIPPGDGVYGQRANCINLPRSAPCAYCHLGYREQQDILTSYIDASQIYGSTNEDTQRLRLGQQGLMKFQAQGGREHLPPSFHPDSDRCSDLENKQYCFRAGDERVNEQPGLTMMHLIWLRQHNRVARTLSQLNRHWPDERIFQETRRIVTAQWQVVVYKEWLPVILGPNFMKQYGLEIDSRYSTYNPNVDATLMNEFAAAAFRFGHTLIQTRFDVVHADGSLTDSIPLAENYFRPFDFYDRQKDHLDSLLRGMLSQPAQRVDRFITNGVTNHLYKHRNESVGLDLVALNIQRGRDHGVRPYIDYVQKCTGITIRCYEDLANSTLMTYDHITALKRVYQTVEEIDLFPGGISETPTPGGVVGPTFACILAEQFRRAKFGDRFFFSHNSENGYRFNEAQLAELKKTTLSSIICDNSDRLKTVQKDAFQPAGPGNEALMCGKLSQPNLNAWKEQ